MRRGKPSKLALAHGERPIVDAPSRTHCHRVHRLRSFVCSLPHRMDAKGQTLSEMMVEEKFVLRDGKQKIEPFCVGLGVICHFERDTSHTFWEICTWNSSSKAMWFG